MRTLSADEARQFALLVLAGVALQDICAIFLPTDPDPDQIAAAVEDWPRQPAVLTALQELTGGIPWQEMSKEARIQLALDKHYAEMAYFLWSHNYSALSAPDAARADVCRKALEAKVAGTAGQGSVLDKFYEEVVQVYRQQQLAKAVKVGRA